MSGLRKSMLAKLSLFVLEEVSTDRQQLGRRLPSDYQQEGSNLPSTCSYTSPHDRRNNRTHASWQYKDLFLFVKSLQYGRKWHALVRDGQKSTTNLHSFRGYIRVSCGLYVPPAGVLRWHQRTNTHSLLGQSFEHAQNLSAGKSDLHAHLRTSPGDIYVKYWLVRAFNGELARKASPERCDRGFSLPVWGVILKQLIVVKIPYIVIVPRACDGEYCQFNSNVRVVVVGSKRPCILTRC